MVKRIQAPLQEEVVRSLRVGDEVLIDGVIYAARDAAHKRMAEAIAQNLALPFNPQGQIIYYVGPCPAPGRVIGSAGHHQRAHGCIYPALLEARPAGYDRQRRAQPGSGAGMRRYGAVYLAAVGARGVPGGGVSLRLKPWLIPNWGRKPC